MATEKPDLQPCERCGVTVPVTELRDWTGELDGLCCGCRAKDAIEAEKTILAVQERKRRGSPMTRPRRIRR